MSLSHERKEEMGILYSAVCGHCGCYIDDHDDPWAYGYRGELLYKRREGFHLSLGSCPGFRVRRVDIKDIVLVSARRLFFGEYQPRIFFDHRGVRKKAEALLRRRRRRWEKAEAKTCPANYGSVILIGWSERYGSVALDMGTA